MGVHLDTDLLVCASVLDSAVRTVHAELLDLANDASNGSFELPEFTNFAAASAGSGSDALGKLSRASNCEDMHGKGNVCGSLERIAARLAVGVRGIPSSGVR